MTRTTVSVPRNLLYSISHSLQHLIMCVAPFTRPGFATLTRAEQTLLANTAATCRSQMRTLNSLLGEIDLSPDPVKPDPPKGS